MKTKTKKDTFIPTYSLLLLFVVATWAAFYSLSDEVLSSSRYGTLPKGLLPSLIYCAIGLSYGLFKDWRISRIKAAGGTTNLLMLSKTGGLLIKLFALTTAVMLPFLISLHLDIITADTGLYALRYLYPILVLIMLIFVRMNYRELVSYTLLNHKKKLKLKFYPQALILLVNFGAIVLLSSVLYMNVFTTTLFPVIACWIVVNYLAYNLSKTAALIHFWRKGKPKKTGTPQRQTDKRKDSKYPIGRL